MTTPQTAVDILRAARKLIEKEENWTHGALARNTKGLIVTPYSANATCFCNIGAVVCVAGHLRALRNEALGYLISAITGERKHVSTRVIGDYNDTHSHAENLALFDKAITLAERDYA